MIHFGGLLLIYYIFLFIHFWGVLEESNVNPLFLYSVLMINVLDHKMCLFHDDVTETLSLKHLIEIREELMLGVLYEVVKLNPEP